MTGFLSLFSYLPLQKLTQDERLPQPESKEQGWEYEQGDGERKGDEESLSGDVSGDR